MDKIATFQERIISAIAEKSITQAELARETGIWASAISDYVKGKYDAKQDKLSLLAKALNVSETWLMGYDVPKERPVLDISTISSQRQDVNRAISVSMVGTAACETVQVSIITDVNHNGIPDQLEEGVNYPTLTIPEVFLSEQCDAKHIFIFRISVPSAERLLPPGRSYVIVRTNITLDCFENGDFALFEKCENQYVVKRVYFSGDNIVIRPFIDHLDYVEYIDHVICVDEFYRRIKGKVIGHFVIDE